MKDRHLITYDSRGEQTLVVQLHNKEIRFIRSDNGFYYFNLEYNNIQHSSVANLAIVSAQPQETNFLQVSCG
jgi:hypothetical protein